MNPMTAATLMIENVNSASPNTFTPPRLIVTINVKKKVIQTASGIGVLQNWIVIDAEIISTGITTSHCIA